MREQLSKNFYRDEFTCRCGCGFDDVDPRLIQGLQKLRDVVHAPVNVNSGCRCPGHNDYIGGEEKSQHLLGKAADIVVRGYTPTEVTEFAELLTEFSNSGIGCYTHFTHLDVRDGKARWTR